MKSLKRVGYGMMVFQFSKQYHNGCDSHPDLEEHKQIANELTVFIKKLIKW